MDPSRIPDDDRLYRSVVFPLAFRRRKAFAGPRFVHLVHKPGALVGSLAWERYLPTQSDIHGFGCRLAARQNEKEKLKTVDGVLAEKDRRIYCGAYQLIAGAIRAMGQMQGLENVMSADVCHLPEDGEIAHVELCFTQKDAIGFDEGTKTAIADRLWNMCRGPLLHDCAYDFDISDHPSSMLITAPLGVMPRDPD